ncbi:hypothetical protein PRECH8_16780 [Insulibacter thermoxylanivorax]|uniref:Uncharacterized protein n=1 Tax=Insulibacter thermoxylanivorax TaxID=2749268 RepID=A0A916QHB0_9BACL|nr:hypothetical protein PRECH8_16780 [Insulibacter thermoxylanivorax]
MDAGPARVTKFSQTPNASYELSGSQTVSAKIHRREGKSPDQQLRSRSVC